MRKLFTLLLTFAAFFSFANEEYDCIDIKKNTAKIYADRYTGIYSNEGQLRYVFKKNNNSIDFSPINSDKQLCYRAHNVGKLKIVSKEGDELSENDVFFNNKIQIYKISVLLLLYLLSIGSIVFYYKIKVSNFFNPFETLELSLGTSVFLFFIISITSSYLISNEFFGKVFITLSILFVLKFVSTFFYSITFNLSNNFGVIIANVFKILNLIFIVVIGLKISSYIQFGTKSIFDIFFYLLLFIFSYFTFYSFIKSEKKIRLSHIFYYLCALEILPFLYLKEFFVV